MHDQDFLNNYFQHRWGSSINKYIYSGLSILDQIHNDDNVLDVGCGSNPFKPYIKNLTGIDPANPSADIITTIENFIPDQKFDIALCLGSINFGDEIIITKQIDKVNSCLNFHAKVFWRLNPGKQDHGHDDCKKITFFPWTFEKLNEFSKKYGFNQTNCAIDTNGKQIRLYAEWHR